MESVDISFLTDEMLAYEDNQHTQQVSAEYDPRIAGTRRTIRKGDKT